MEERLFSFWAIRSVSVAMEEAIPDESIMNATGDSKILAKILVPIIQNFYSLGKNLSNLTKSDLKGNLDDIQGKYKDLIPKAEILLALTTTTGLIACQEWNDMQFSHTFRPSDSGKFSRYTL